MSFIGGSFVINGKTQKDLNDAALAIRDVVRGNANLHEFPHMGERILPIRDISGGKIFPDRDAAQAEIDDERHLWERRYNVMIPFRDTDALPPTKEMLSLKEREKKMRQDLAAYEKSHTIFSQKAEYVSCKKCGSKLKKNLLHGERCPLCHTDLRSNTVQERIKKYNTDIAELSKKYREAAGKRREKCPVRYLVAYVEYVG